MAKLQANGSTLATVVRREVHEGIAPEGCTEFETRYRFMSNGRVLSQTRVTYRDRPGEWSGYRLAGSWRDEGGAHEAARNYAGFWRTRGYQVTVS